MFATIGFLMSTGRSSIASLTGAWAASGCLATGVGIWQLRVGPSSPADAWRWLKRQRDLAPRFFTEFAVSIGAANLTFFAIGALAGLAALGQVRAGQIALGPLNVLFAGVGLVTVPESVRLLHESPRRLLIGDSEIGAGDVRHVGEPIRLGESHDPPGIGRLLVPDLLPVANVPT